MAAEDIVGGLGVAIAVFLLVVLAICFYFLPAFIAKRRNAKNEGLITVINLVFGWTVLGWIAALLWAVTDSERPERGEHVSSAEIKKRLAAKADR